MQQNLLVSPAPFALASALIGAAALVACGGGSDSATVPGAPTIGAATAGSASASIAFTAPASNGGSAIIGYVATCVAGTASGTGSGTASPLTVSGLTNGSSYSCSVTASNAVGTSVASATVAVTPIAATTTSGTAGVECGYSYSAFNSTPSVNAISTSAWTCSSTARTLSANGIPDHAVGTFPNPDNPNTISAQTISATFTLAPTATTTATALGGPAGVIAYVLNGIKFDPGTNGACDNSGSTCALGALVGPWNIEALGQSSFKFGTDSNNAHVQPDGVYHYHGMPEGFIAERGGAATKLTLIGWAADGFPIYARYGYSDAASAASAVKLISSSYRLKTTPDANRPATSLYAMGAFTQDYEYVAGLGDLDQCNGRTGVTPEFPNGIYHYYATDSYPFLQRCVKGAVTTTRPPGP